ncbi:putative DNA-binding domain-containing protein [Cardiobacteriaceae bacterium TAE3-ERU3]|nr:putative DNA-binding domain-containing protein [Cardiobacteriaceae bacterium TAE3-ERU3]
MTTPPIALQQFQRDFGRYLRDPEHAACPSGIPDRAANTYQELIFNNIRSFTDACFPVCRKIVSRDTWQALVRDFFRSGTTDDPMFTSIPAQFVAYLQSEPRGFDLPPWFAALAHYEWIELAVDTDSGDPQATDTALLDNAATHITTYLSETSPASFDLVTNPTLHSLHYHWPVHRISADNQPDTPQDTYLFVFRDHDHRVRFIAANAMTAALVAFLDEAPSRHESSLLAQFANHIGFADQQKLLSFIVPLLADFVQQNLFTLIQKTPK